MVENQMVGFQPALEKIQECKFFIALMERYEKEPKEFGFCLSAYLSAFRSIFERLKNTTPEIIPRRMVRKEVANFLEFSPAINFLVKARNVEVHREGVRIELIRRLDPSIPRRPGARFSARLTRFEDPFCSGPNRRVRRAWAFREMPKAEIVTLCRDSLESSQQLVIRLAGTSRSTYPT